MLSVCKLRCGAHKLPCIADCFNETDTGFENSTGDEFHYLFECNYFQDSRELFIKIYFRHRPNILKLNKLFNTKLEMFRQTGEVYQDSLGLFYLVSL